MNGSARGDIIDDLRERLRRLEHAHRPARASAWATGTALDQLLPHNGLVDGTLIEWLADGEGSGMATLALLLAGRRLQAEGCLVVLDGKREFYPPAAASLGVPLERTIVVQPTSASDALWALEQSLRCQAVRIALAWIDALPDRAFRRLQLAAETGGSVGFLLRPIARRAEPSWAEARLLVQPLPTPADVAGRWLRVEVLYCRGGAAGKTIELELSEEAGVVPCRRAAPSWRAGPVKALVASVSEKKTPERV